MSRRPRGRGRKPQHNNNHNHNKNPNRSLDSNGPDIRVRGSAKTIFDKYTALAHDASVSGYRVKAENYLQHAEHYFRIVQEIAEKTAAKAELHQKEQAKIQAKKQEQRQEQAQKQEQASGNEQDTQKDDGDKSAGRSRSYLNRRRDSNGQANAGEAISEEPVQAEKKKSKKPKKVESTAKTKASEDETAAAE